MRGRARGEKRLGRIFFHVFSIRSRLALQHMQPKPVEAMPPEAMPPPPPGALIPNIVEQSVESIKAVGVATVHSAKAIGTTTNKPQIEPSARPLRSIDVSGRSDGQLGGTYSWEELCVY